MTKLQREVKYKLRGCLNLAELYFGIQFPQPSVSFNMKGGVAGQVCLVDQILQIKFNNDILNVKENREEFLTVTVPHEVAHYVVICRALRDQVHIIPKPHGKEWKWVMREVFKLKPNRCHSLKVPDSTRRKTTRVVTYACGCREHLLTVKMHKKLQSGRCATCCACHEKVRYVKGG